MSVGVRLVRSAPVDNSALMWRRPLNRRARSVVVQGGTCCSIALNCAGTAQGTFNDENMQSACKPCAAGRYSDQYGQTLCESYLRIGKYSDQQARSTESACKDDRGLFSGQSGQAACLPCAVGKFNNQTGQSCKDCGTGLFNDQVGRTRCKPCATGLYNDQRGQVKCEGSVTVGTSMT